MLALGLYWCVEVYKAWTDQPVLTTIKTAELPVDEVIKACGNIKRVQNTKHLFSN
jgi:hypothetical protein